MLQMGLKPGAETPNFIAQTLDGKTVEKANYTGRKLVLVFISPNCAPCREAMPKYKEWYLKAKRAGVEFVLVSSAGKDETDALAVDFELDQPIVFAPQETNSFLKDYQASGTPSYCFIDEEGVVQSAGHLVDHEGGAWKRIIDEW